MRTWSRNGRRLVAKHVTPPSLKKIWVDGKLVEFLPPGCYMYPPNGHSYTLYGAMGMHSGPGYVVSGWPPFWRELVPAGDS